MKQNEVESILSCIPAPHIDGIIVIDRDGLILAFDNAAESLFGYQQDEIIGQPLTLLMSQTQAKEHPIYVTQAVKEKTTSAHSLNAKRTIVGQHKQGHLIPLAITVSTNKSNENILFTGVIQDLRKHEDRLTQISQSFNRATLELNQRIQFDAILNKHGNRLLSCHEDDFVPVMEDALQNFGEFLSFDHCFILKFNEDLNEGRPWAEWRRSVSLINPFPNRFNIPYSHIFLEAYSKTETLILTGDKDQSEEALTLFKLANALSPNGFISSRITPILNERDVPAGCIGFSTLDPSHQPSESQITLLNTVTQFLINAWGRHQLIVKSHKTEQKLRNANKILSQQALNDALTGLPNRRAFDHGLSQEFDRAQRHCNSVCLLICDIDFFKHYNDHFGHIKGDYCLQQVAEIIQRTFNRAGELCARYGGEEFAVVLPAISHEEATEQAQRLLNNLLAAKIPHAPSSKQTYLTMSIGIARYSPTQLFETTEALINAADTALYFAKDNGRNQLAWATEAE